MYYLQKSLFKFSQIYYNRTFSLKTKLMCFTQINCEKAGRKRCLFYARMYMYFYYFYTYYFCENYFM